MSGLEGLSQEALEALAESLQLSREELEQLAQGIRDLKSLEKALKTLQLAKQVNAQKGLDGKECASCKTVDDYAELYKKILAAAGTGASAGKPGTGPGMKGPGVGEGGKAVEEPSETAFKTELSKSSLTAGEMLLRWKTREVSESGQSEEDFVRCVREVKQGVSEAILQEQVPPGYHQAIKKYFDAMSEEVEKPPSK